MVSLKQTKDGLKFSHEEFEFFLIIIFAAGAFLIYALLIQIINLSGIYYSELGAYFYGFFGIMNII